MNNQHTPGPWIVDATPPVAPCSFKIRAKAEKCDAWIPIATVYSVDMRTEENAQLIAKAPELLAENIRLKAQIQSSNAPTEMTPNELESYCSELLTQRNALLEAIVAATDSLCALVNGEVVISNKGHKLYTFPDQSACLSEHDPKVIKARSAISQARNAIALAQGDAK